jgi:hypothetical protein
MKKLFVIVSLVLLGTAVARGEDRPLNGYWWTASSSDLKVGFVSGFAYAMVYVHDATFVQCMAHTATQKGLPVEQYPGDELWEKCAKDPKLAPSDFSGIPIGQLVDGVDEFYKDFRNKDIDIKYALVYVRDELKGKKSPEELDRMLKGFRTTPTH